MEAVFPTDTSELEQAATLLRVHPEIADGVRVEVRRRPVSQVVFKIPT